MSFLKKNNLRFQSESTWNRSDSEQTISTRNPLGIRSEPLGTARNLSGNWVSARNPIGSDRKTWGTEKYCLLIQMYLSNQSNMCHVICKILKNAQVKSWQH